MDINSAFNLVGYQLQMTHFLSNCEHQLVRCRFLMLHSTTLTRKICSSALAYTKTAQRKGQLVVLFCLVKNSWYYLFSFCPFKKAQSTCSLECLSAVRHRTTTHHCSWEQQGNIRKKIKAQLWNPFSQIKLWHIDNSEENKSTDSA